MPDGKTASEAEMVDAMKAFKAYNEEVTAFGACLDQETKSKAAGTAQLMQLKTHADEEAQRRRRRAAGQGQGLQRAGAHLQSPQLSLAEPRPAADPAMAAWPSP